MDNKIKEKFACISVRQNSILKSHETKMMQKMYEVWLSNRERT